MVLGADDLVSFFVIPQQYIRRLATDRFRSGADRLSTETGLAGPG